MIAPPFRIPRRMRPVEILAASFQWLIADGPQVPDLPGRNPSNSTARRREVIANNLQVFHQPYHTIGTGMGRWGILIVFGCCGGPARRSPRTLFWIAPSGFLINTTGSTQR